MTKRLFFRDFVKPGEWFHFHRAWVNGEHPRGLHTHDFDEIFFIEKGSGTHRINGTEDKLSAGDLVFIRARDTHTFTGNGMVMANTGFPKQILARIARDYFPKNAFFLGKKMPRMHGRAASDQPFRVGLESKTQTWLRERMLGLAASARSRFDLDLFLLELLARLPETLGQKKAKSSKLGADPLRRAPPWLREVFEAASDPKYFSIGTKSLAELSGRSAEHLAREVKKWTGKTPTDLLNEARLTFASEKLSTGERTISEISEACGFENPAHFHRLFRRRFGLSPGKYREESGRILGLRGKI